MSKRSADWCCWLLLSASALGACDAFVSAPERLERAEQMIEARRYSAASIELKTLLRAQPDNGRARLMLAEVDLRMGDAMAADKEMHRAVELVGASDESSDLRARIWLANGRHYELLSAIERSELHLKEPNRSIYTGRALLQAQDPGSALKAFSEALSVEPRNLEGLTGRAVAQRMLGDEEAAEASLRDLLADDPWNFEANIELSGILTRDGRVSAGRKILRRLAARSGQLDDHQRLRLRVATAESDLANGDEQAASESLAELTRVAPSVPDSILLAARAAMANGHYVAASAKLQRALAAHADFAPARVLLGEALLAQGQVEQARVQLEKVAEEHPEQLKARRLLAGLSRISEAHDACGSELLLPTSGVLRADSQAEDGGLLVAATAERSRTTGEGLKTLLRDQPDDLRALNVAGLCYARRGELERANFIINRALSSHPSDPSTLLNSARIELTAGNRQIARLRLERLAREHPESSAARHALARLAKSDGDFRSAAKWLEQVRKEDPGAPPAALELTRLYLKQQDSVRAAAVLKDLERHSDQPAKVLNTIGLLYLEASRPDAARSSFQAALRVDPTNAGYRSNLARAYLALGDLASAHGQVREALKSEPSSLEALSVLLELEVRQSRRDAAIRSLATLVAERPDDPNVRVLEGDFNMSIRAYESAARAYEIASQLRMDRATALKLYRARRSGKLGGDLGALEVWVEHHPEDFAIQRELAEQYRGRDQRERAIVKYSLLVENGTADPETLSTLALLYHETGDSRAGQLARRAYGVAPERPFVAHVYGRILLDEGNVQAALKILGESAAARSDDPDLSFHYAEALAKAGRCGDARERLRFILEGGEAFASRPQAKLLFDELCR